VVLLLLALACGDDDPSSLDGGRRADGGARSDGGPDARGRDGGSDGGSDDGGGIDAARPDGSMPAPGAIRFVENAPREHEYGVLTALPPAFGTGDFTLELFLRPDASFPVGPTAGGEDQRRNWSDSDERPYSSGSWWYPGNFLLDGHNNARFGAGTFSLQFYGGGRVRWLVGDQGDPGPGELWSSQAFPASSTATLLDGEWHRVAVVRRERALELWIDAAMIASTASTERTDLRRWFDAWEDFYPEQAGWFFGAEKQAAIGALEQYEDYKGELAELRFWSEARSREALPDFDRPIARLAGWFRFDEGRGDRACDSLDRTRCIELFRFRDELWSTDAPPLRR
jgi:hypothetical protein